MLDDQIIPFYFKASPGMDNHTDELDLNGQRVRLAQNCRFEEEPGGVTKRPNLAYYNTAEMGSSGGMLGTYRFYSAAGAKQICVRDSGVYVGDDATGTMTQIRTLSTTTLKMSFVTYNKLMIAGNGTDNLFVYDGSSDNVTWELGSCKAVKGTSTGITRTAISYQVEITLSTGSYVCGAISNEIQSVTNESINLSYIPLGPTGTTSRSIYRKSSETSGYRLIATLSNNTDTTYTDTTADASAGTQLPTVTDDMPKGKFLLIHRERLFIAGDPDAESNIYYSNPLLPHIIQQTTNLDYISVSKDDGDKITGIKNFQGILMCIKQNNIRKIGVSSALSNADPTSWYVEDPIAQIGSPAPWSIVETPFGVVFLGWDQWYVCDGGVPKPILAQFNCRNILPSLYNSVVSYFNAGILYAAYADKESSPQENNRIMCYDYLLDKFSVDTISANCFASASGIDEASELYIGSSSGGWLYKAEEGDNWHRLAGKTQATKGTENTTFVGGSEASPTIEIGSAVSASAIPANVCIFWMDEETNPGSGWTEITACDGKFFYISDDAVGTTGGTENHTHSITAKLEMSNAKELDSGDGGVWSTDTQHTHTGSGTSSSDSALPKNVKLRIFYKNTTTTEYLFPVGALVLWDQSDEPDGWLARSDLDTCYLLSGTTGLIADKNPSHSHTFSFTSNSGGTGQDADIGNTPTSSTLSHPHYPHTHLLTGTLASADTSGWDLDAITFRVIQKVGEESSWDGANKYCFCLYYSDTAIGGTGWTDVTTSYDGKYILAGETPLTVVSKSQSDISVTVDATTNVFSATDHGLHDNDVVFISATTLPGGITADTIYYVVSALTNTFKVSASVGGSAVNVTTAGTTVVVSKRGATHTHDQDSTTVANNQGYGTIAGYHNQAIITHNHIATLTVATTELPDPPYFSFRLVKKILGQMSEYNSAVLTHAGNGIYESPAIQINAESMGIMYMNISKSIADTVNVYFRSGATQTAVETGIAVTFNATTDTFTATSHGLSNNDTVSVSATVLPTGFSNAIIYYVINAATNTFQLSLSQGGSAVDASTSGTSVVVKEWGYIMTKSGDEMTVPVNDWIQYLVEFIAADTLTQIPKLYTVDGYLLKFSYRRAGTVAESSVEFIYDTGNLNFDEPMLDKIFKKIISEHSGTQGSLTVTWTTENATGSFTFDLATYPKRWQSFFHSTAMGSTIAMRFYKNDLYPVTLKEFKGLLTPQPMLI